MISTVIITKNEESNIQECLESCKWVDEIIIVDAESTDDTVALAKAYTNKVYIRAWHSYADAKNFGIDQARGKWILCLDADERLTVDLSTEIKLAIKNDQYDAYRVPRLTYFCGKAMKHGGCYPDWQLRLFKKEKGRFANVKVHEGIEMLNQNENGYLKNHLLHYSYKTMSQYWGKFNRYTSLSAQEKYSRGKKFRFYYLFTLPWQMFYRLVLRCGLLDGMLGIFYHVFSAMATFVKYVKLWELERKREAKK